MTEIQQLYQEVILDHNKNPRNFGELPSCTNHAEGKNPLCGDHIDISLLIENDVITDLKFSGSGCAISKASASIMTSEVKNKSILEAKELFEQFHDLVTCAKDKEIDLDKFGKLAVFGGVREFPARVKCASLAWHTLISAIDNKNEIAITE
ncbi:MAG: SUF system NifU family Fe-S cluster assembly protein [Candidatus Kapabacteria bacterium]|nr:SUF system NifU family Fe-S cluster assembly protein [Candidatus Kapabacteria bacterium]